MKGKGGGSCPNGVWGGCQCYPKDGIRRKEDNIWYDEHGETGYWGEDGEWYDYMDEIGYYSDGGTWHEYDYTTGYWDDEGEWKLKVKRW